VYFRFLPVLALLLAGCGDLPRPFMGYPGATAKRLSQPPPARLAVPTPTDALLPDDAAHRLAAAIAGALVDEEVPAVAEAIKDGDWRLVIAAETQGNDVVPTYTVQDPKGEAKGTSQGAPVPTAAWASGDAKMLQATADAAAPKIASLLTTIEAVRRQNDPNSLYNRPAKIRVVDVTGAPGDGNNALAKQMRGELPKLGQMVQDDPIGADFTVAGQVLVVPIAGGQQRVEVQWIVSDASGTERGRIIQLNEIPAGTLDHYWGDVAAVVAKEAAGGVKDVVLQQAGRRDPAVKPPPAS